MPGTDTASRAEGGLSPSSGDAPYDFFIAYATGDQPFATELFTALEANHRVFLASESTRQLPGDDWDVTIPSAQRRSRVTVVLLSSRTGGAYYQRIEIATAINLARQDPDSHRVIPVYIEGKPADPSHIPYGLELKVWLDARALGGAPRVAEELRRTLAALGGEPFEDAPVAEPFRLLRSFRREDARLFFGRELYKRDLSALVDEHRLVVLHGASGTGKSSLVQAGLKPLLEGRYQWLDVTPGKDLGGALSAVVSAALAERGVAPEASGAGKGLLQLARGGTSVLLVIDQAEELFQHRTDEGIKAAAKALEKELRPCLTASAQAGDVHVLLSIRDDYFGHLSYLKQAGLPVFDHELLLRPLDRTSTQLAIEEPLRLAGRRIERELVRRIVDDLSKEDAEVKPVELEVICQALFEAAVAAKTTVIDAALYDGMGGAGQVLATYLRRALDRIDPKLALPARKLLSRMIGANGARQPPMSLDELVQRTGLAPSELEQVTAHLVPLRVLEASAAEADPAPRYRIAHDLVAKEVFAKLDADERAELALREKIDRATEEWVDRGRTLRNRHLSEADRQLFDSREARGVASTLDAAAFLRAVARLARRNKLWRWAGIAVGVVVGISGALALSRAQRVFREAQAERFEAVAEGALARDPATALGPLRQAILLRDNKMMLGRHYELALNALQAGLGYTVGEVGNGDSPKLVFSPISTGGPCAFCWPDRRLLAMGGANGKVILFDLADGQWSPLKTPLEATPAGVSVLGLGFLPDQNALVALWSDGSLLIWTLEPRLGAIQTARRIQVEGAASLVISPRAKRVVMGKRGGTVLSWRTDALLAAAASTADALGKVKSVAEVFDPVPGFGDDSRAAPELAFGPDNDEAVFAFYRSPKITSRTSLLLRIEKGQARRAVSTPGLILRFAVGAEGRVAAEIWNGKAMTMVVQASPASSVEVLNAGTDESASEVVHSFAFSSPEVLWGVTSERRFLTWFKMSSSWSSPVRVTNFLGEAASASVSPGGEWLAIGDGVSGSAIQILRFDEESIRADLRGHARSVMRTVFSPDGRWLASADSGGFVRLWPLPAGARTRSSRHGISANRGSCGGVPVGAPGRLIGCLASGAWVLEGEEGVVVQEGGTSRKLDAPAKSLVALSPKGGYLAIAGPQRRIRIWSASPFTEKAELTAEGDVRALAVSDGGHLLAVYTGHLLRVLLQDGAVVGTFQTSELEALSFSADGSQLVGFSGDPQQADWVWALPPAEPEALVRWLAERSSDPYLDEAVTLGKDDILYKYKPLMGHDLP